jgi:hypothetical protein
MVATVEHPFRLFKFNLNRTQAAMTELWPIGEDLMTTYSSSRRNEPLPNPNVHDLNSH